MKVLIDDKIHLYMMSIMNLLILFCIQIELKKSRDLNMMQFDWS